MRVNAGYLRYSIAKDEMYGSNADVRMSSNLIVDEIRNDHIHQRMLVAYIGDKVRDPTGLELRPSCC